MTQPSIRPAVHQFHSGSAQGDGVTNSLFYTQRLLRALGFESEIFVQHCDPRLGRSIRPHAELAGRPGDVLLVHHSMGHDLTDWVMKRPETKVLVYHNITPSHLLPPPHRPYAELGRRQLEVFRPAMAAAVAVSPFNAEELAGLGYDRLSVIPLLVDLARLRGTLPEPPPGRAAGRRTPGAPFTVLTVGRVCEHKCQHQILEVAAQVRRLTRTPVEFVMVGGWDEGGSYITGLNRHISEQRLDGRVRLTGKVSDGELCGWYQAADALLSLSDHEGFCMPLIEAMAWDVPVVAYGSGNVPATLGQAGLLLSAKPAAEIAGLLVHLMSDKALRRRLIAGGRRRLAELEPGVVRGQLAALLGGLGLDVCRAADAAAPPPLAWRVEGPCETTYSLALVNRMLGFALERTTPGPVGARPMEGVGDYRVDAAAVAAIPGLGAMIDRAGGGRQARAVLRNCYPPRVHDMDGEINIQQLAWEESRLPPAWIDSFNRSLDALAVPTEFVRKILIDAGATVPIRVSGHGIDHILDIQPEPWTGRLGKRFKFLHVSSCFPRKGVDVLLAAYGRAFGAGDDVTLVIKSFPNPHNTLARQVAELRAARGADCPDIVVIEEDLPPARLLGLYQAADILVGPSRGEGFGLPFAEAMAMGVPVIVTGHGAQLDFCTPDLAWLIDYRFEPADSHHGVPYSVWAEPDPDHLARLMREAYALPEAERRQRGERARSRVRDTLRWDRCAGILNDLVAELTARPIARTSVRLGWVSTYNSRCGIATYSGFLVEALAPDRFEVTVLANREPPVGPDPAEVVRCWRNRDDPDLSELLAEVEARRLEAVVIQFNYAFYELARLGWLIDQLKARGVVVVIMFHATGDVMDGGKVRFSLTEITAALGRCDRLLVHSLKDLNRLRAMGLDRVSTLFPHGALCRPETPVDAARRALKLERYGTIIGMYGFALPNKGLTETIEALPAILERRPDTLLLLVNALYPNPVSDDTLRRCGEAVRRLGLERHVVFVTDYLEHEESLRLLEAADLLVFPYQHSNESASGAVKVGLAANRPVLVTPLAIFSDLDGVVEQLPGTDSAAIACGVLDLLADPARMDAARARQRTWLDTHDWNRLAHWLGNIVTSLVINRTGDTP